MIDWKHIIPGYALYDLVMTVQSDETPFAIKARDSAMAGATLGLHTIFGTHHAVKILEHQIKTVGFYSGRTYGWGFIRHMIKTSPFTAAATLQAAAGAHIESGAMTGIDLYTAPQRRRVEETGFTGINPHYRSV